MKTRGYIFGISVLVLILALSLCACGKKATDEPTEDTAATTTAAATTAPTEAPEQTGFPFTGYVDATTLNVRPTAGQSGYAVGGLKWGDTVTVLSCENDWYAIRFPWTDSEGKAHDTAYVHAQYIKDTPPTLTTTTVETAATAAP